MIVERLPAPALFFHETRARLRIGQRPVDDPVFEEFVEKIVEANGEALAAPAGSEAGPSALTGLMTALVGLKLSREGECTWRSGVRWTFEPDVSPGVESTRREFTHDDASEHELEFSAHLRWRGQPVARAECGGAIPPSSPALASRPSNLWRTLPGTDLGEGVFE